MTEFIAQSGKIVYVSSVLVVGLLVSGLLAVLVVQGSHFILTQGRETGIETIGKSVNVMACLISF
jgi:hypothetical protein